MPSNKILITIFKWRIIDTFFRKKSIANKPKAVWKTITAMSKKSPKTNRKVFEKITYPKCL